MLNRPGGRLERSLGDTSVFSDCPGGVSGTSDSDYEHISVWGLSVFTRVQTMTRLNFETTPFVWVLMRGHGIIRHECGTAGPAWS